MGQIYRVDSKCRPHRPQQFKFTPGEWSYSTRQTPRVPCLNIPLKKQVTSETSITSCLVLQKKQQRNSKQSITKFYDDLILQNTSSNKHNCWSPSLLWQFCAVFTSYVTSTVSKSNSNSKCIISQHCGRLTIPFQFLLSSVEPAASSQTTVRLRHRPDLACLPALDRDLIPLNMHTDQFTGWTLSTSSTRSILLMWIALTTVLEIHGVGVNKTSPILLPNQQCQSTENNSSTDSNTQQEFLDRRSSTVERPSTQLWSPSLWLFQTISENSFIWWPKCWVTLLNL